MVLPMYQDEEQQRSLMTAQENTVLVALMSTVRGEWLVKGWVA